MKAGAIGWAKLLLLGTLIALTGTGCSGQSRGLESELCAIYDAVNRSGSRERSDREGELAQSIQAEVPVFFNEHYVSLMQVDWADRPATIGRLLVQIDNKGSLELCDPIQRYYSLDGE